MQSFDKIGKNIIAAPHLFFRVKKNARTPQFPVHLKNYQTDQIFSIPNVSPFPKISPWGNYRMGLFSAEYGTKHLSPVSDITTSIN